MSLAMSVTVGVGGCGCGVRAGAVGRRRGAAGVRRVGVEAKASAASINFVKGVEEPVIPDVRLTRSRDGSSGTAYFRFDQPNVFEVSNELGAITGMYLQDEEGEISSRDVSAKFLNGKPSALEAKLVMRTPAEWDRFMRFMERYAEANELGFQRSK